MTENQKQISSSDEIDLGVLFSKIGDFFRNIGIGVLRFLAVLRRVPLENKTLFISLTIIGLIGGYSYSNFISKKFYSTTMILSSEYLNKRIVDNTIDKLNQLADEKEKLGLAKVLSISIELAQNINDFEAKPFVAETELIELEILKEQLKNFQSDKKNEKVITQVIERIEIENRHAYEITVRVYNPTVVRELESAIVNYFKNNEYLKKRVEISKTNRLARKQKLTKESQKLDSLKEVIYANGNKPISEDGFTSPVSVYGKTKLGGEKKVLETLQNAYVIRTAWVYSVFGKNFVKTMIAFGKQRDSLNVVYDQIGSPTNAADLADAILKIIQSIEAGIDTPGIYHYSNEGVISWFDFAYEIMRQAKLNCKVCPILTHEYPTVAKRPAFSVLNKTKIKQTFGIQIPYWTESLEKTIKELTA